ncbi:MAG: ROK family protein [Candidatus Omnitrophota bacterium]
MKSKKLAVGIDVGGTQVKIAVVNRQGRILHRSKFDLEKSGPWKKTLEILAKAVENLLTAHRIPKRAVLGVGVGLPGLIDYRKGLVHHLVNVKGWKRVPAASVLRQRLKLPVFVDNDVNVMALGEAAFGAARGFANVVCLTLGTGVGGGLILEGEIYRGASLSAGEVGHIPVTRKGPQCACGSQGCLETYVGNQAIVRRAAERILAGEQSLASQLVDGKLNQLTPEVLSQAAREGDHLACSVWKEIGGWLGFALTGIVHVYNPDRIVIGGGVAEAGEILFGPLRETLREYAMDFPLKHLKVVKAKLGNDAGVIGASVLARRSNEADTYGA